MVLPLLQAEVVPPGWITNDRFVAGYGAAQAVPGPLFTFAAYLGSSIDTLSSRWLSGLFTLAAVFLPSFLLIVGAFPFWNALREHAPETLKSTLNAVYVPQLGEPQHIAALVAYFSSDEAAYTNGAMISCDGGLDAVITPWMAQGKLMN